MPCLKDGTMIMVYELGQILPFPCKPEVRMALFDKIILRGNTVIANPGPIL